MKIKIIILLAAFTFISCGARKTRKTEYKENKTETSRDTTAIVSETKTTTVIDTTITVKGEEAKASKPLEDLKRGDTLKTETNRHSTKTYYDKKTKSVVTDTKVKDEVIPLKARVYKENKTTTNKGTNKTSSTEILASQKDTERKTDFYNTVTKIIIIFVIALIVYLIARRFAKKKLKNFK